MAQTDVAAAARTARQTLERLLGAQPALAGSLPTGCIDVLEHYVALLLDANRRLNLTRIVEPEAVAHRHLLDALAGLPFLDREAPQSAVDMGSGGGLPGIPLAAARPDVRWLLVDSATKKADAVRGFVEALSLPNVAVVAERAEDIGRRTEHRERHDLVVARACAALPVVAELALPLLRVDGMLLAWKGPLTEADDEVRAGRAALAQLGGGELALEPTVSAGSVMVVVRKTGPVPDRFPRRPGVPARRPLA